MELYLIWRTDDIGYDEHDAIVVCAESEEDALNMVTNENQIPSATVFDTHDYFGYVKHPDVLKAVYIGIPATDMRRGVVLASFNAG